MSNQISDFIRNQRDGPDYAKWKRSQIVVGAEGCYILYGNKFKQS